MDEKQTRYFLDLLKRRYGVGDSIQSDEDWIDSHIQNIYKAGKGEWEPWRVTEYLDNLYAELEKRSTN